MTATLFSLIAVTIGFSTLVIWVYWPSRRQRLESLGQIPLEDGQIALEDGQIALEDGQITLEVGEHPDE